MEKTFVKLWGQFFNNKKIRNEFFITLILLITTLFLFTRFLIFVEGRKGVVLNDPILSLFNPINTNWITFALIYVSILTAIFSLLKNPNKLTLAFQSYILLVIIRTAAMYSVPLDPPATMISLIDPFVKYFGTGIQMNKDFFFSGHTATLFLLFLVSENKKLKLIFLVCSLAVGLSVLLAHTHYTVDVIAAPFFAYGVYRIAFLLRGKILLTQKLFRDNND